MQSGLLSLRSNLKQRRRWAVTALSCLLLFMNQVMGAEKDVLAPGQDRDTPESKPEAKSGSKSEAKRDFDNLSEKMIKKFEYAPVDVVLFARLNKLRADKKYLEMFEEAYDVASRLGFAKLEGAEGAYFAAIALNEMGYSYGAFYYFMRIIRAHPGSIVARSSLIEVEKLASVIEIDEEDVGRAVNQGNFSELPPAVQQMTYYFTALDNMRRGLWEWVDSSSSRLSPESFWGARFNYYRALEMVRMERSEQALIEFRSLSENKALPEILRRKAAWQHARLLFERNQHENAESIYAGFLFPGREFGRVLLERAWIRFYTKDYSVALGMLRSLRSPYFNSSRSPEQYVLEMIIYRELCHYKAAKETAKEFDRIFGGTVKAIQDRQPLEQSDLLMSMALQRAGFLPMADLVARIRREMADMQKALSKSRVNIGPILAEYSYREKEIRTRMQPRLQKQLRAEAEAVLEASDQVRLMEYMAGLDQLRIRSGVEERLYQSEKIERFSFDQLYWPLEKEYWWDELNNYRVLISDQCSQGGGK